MDSLYISENHEPIIDKELFDTVQEILHEKQKENPHTAPYDYDFKGMVFCGNCGAKYYKKRMHKGTPSEKYVWRCGAYSNGGKAKCASKQIPDDVLCKMAAQLDKPIERIIIHCENKVEFIFTDGSSDLRSWEIDRKWSDEMKQRNHDSLRRREA